MQRICNKETRFAKSPAYLYYATGFLEEQRIRNNIGLVGNRGKKLVSEEGKISYELDDPFRVLEKIKNTPKYWLEEKYNMNARLENFGAFHLFFTLSCGDKRWMDNFAAILRDLGHEVNYVCGVKKDENGGDKSWDYSIEVRSANGQ